MIELDRGPSKALAQHLANAPGYPAAERKLFVSGIDTGHDVSSEVLLRTCAGCLAGCASRRRVARSGRRNEACSPWPQRNRVLRTCGDGNRGRPFGRWELVAALANSFAPATTRSSRCKRTRVRPNGSPATGTDPRVGSWPTCRSRTRTPTCVGRGTIWPLVRLGRSEGYVTAEARRATS
jgi:hypothetical protein